MFRTTEPAPKTTSLPPSVAAGIHSPISTIGAAAMRAHRHWPSASAVKGCRPSAVWGKMEPARPAADLVDRLRNDRMDEFDREAARVGDWRLARFAGKTALVTGGASGIGRATAIRLAVEGATVWIADRQAPAAGDPVGRAARFLPLDVTDAAAVERAVAGIVAEAGALDVVVNAAGIATAGTAQGTTIADWARVIDVNLTGTFTVGGSAMRAMAGRGGAIVNIASDAGLVGQAGQAAYCASKGGVVQLTRAAALDGAKDAIRVNCVCPCFVETPLVRQWLAAQPDPAAARAAAEADQPIGRMGEPHEIAAAIAFLASHEANFVTGIALAVDGGTTAR